MSQNYDRFIELLNENFQFPTKYIHKFIGPNSDEFRNAVADFEKKFIGLTKTGERLSSSSQHVSLTYEYLAANAEDVVHLTKETHNILGVLYIL